LFLPAGEEELMSPNVSPRPGKGTAMHKNAHLTPKGREVLVQRLCSGQRPPPQFG
jgi:hypothetical protein